MTLATRQKAARAALALTAAAVLLFSAGLRLAPLDGPTDAYFRDAITRAGLAYAACRVVNASVSVAKESSLQLEPAGVGVSLAVGQALDPIDDMAERLSDVLVTAIAALGVQKLAYEIGVLAAPPVAAVLLVVLAVLVWFEDARLRRLARAALGMLALVAVARFCLPFSSMANVFVQQHFFDDRMAEASQRLSLGQAELDELVDFSLPEIEGLVDTLRNSAAFLKRKTAAFQDAVVHTVRNAGTIVESLLQLTLLYVGVFLIQVIALPLLTLWLMARTISALLPTGLPAATCRPTMQRPAASSS